MAMHAFNATIQEAEVSGLYILKDSLGYSPDTYKQTQPYNPDDQINKVWQYFFSPETGSHYVALAVLELNM